MSSADATFISIGLALTVGLGLLIFFNGGWIGLAAYAVALMLIFGFAG